MKLLPGAHFAVPVGQGGRAGDAAALSAAAGQRTTVGGTASEAACQFRLIALAHGRRATTVGLVTMRQSPGTAKWVTFVTLEDETGHTNVIVWTIDAEAR